MDGIKKINGQEKTIVNVSADLKKVCVFILYDKL